MVRACTLTALLGGTAPTGLTIVGWLQWAGAYSVFAAALAQPSVSDALLASPVDAALFLAPDDAALAALGITNGVTWANSYPAQVLYYVARLPDGWPSLPPGYYEVATLAPQPMTLLLSSGGGVTAPALAPCPLVVRPKALPCCAKLAFLPSGQTLAAAWAPPLLTLQQALAAQPSVSIFAGWLQTRLTQTFAQRGEYTILAPTNAALTAAAASLASTTAEIFVAVPCSAELLGYQLVPGAVQLPSVDGSKFSTPASDGRLLTVSRFGGVTSINGAAVLSTQATANGLLVIVDALLVHGASRA